jgi:DNA-binding SARP family transcriptional activator/tetratricopeptide (TPR) repeat protein
LFGGASIEGNDGPITGRGAQRRRLGLLAILAVAGRAVSRDKLVAYLWEETDTERARKLLSESIYVIRKAVGEQALIAVGDTVELNRDLVWSDVGEFMEALAAHDDERAVQVYRGPFLDGFFISDAPEFENWAETERQVFARRRSEALLRIAKRAEERRAYPEALQAWRQLTEQDRFNASYAIGLMRCLDASGDRAAALQHARIHSALLKSEFDAEPDADVAAFALTLQTSNTPTTSTTRLAPVPAIPGDAGITKSDVAPRRTMSKRASIGTAVVVLAIIAGAIALASRGARTGSAPASDVEMRVAVLPFAIRGAESELRDGMVDLLSHNLDGAGAIRSVDSHSILSQLDDDDPISPEQGARIAERFGATHFVLGDVTRAGALLHINATLYADTVKVAEASERGPADSLLSLADRLTTQLLAGQVSEGELTGLAAHTTTSYSALKHYLEGEALYRAARYGDAASAFVRALREDPKFALADYRLSAAAEFSFDFQLARRAAARAIQHSERLPNRERMLVRAWNNFLNGNAQAAQREYEAVLTAYPSDIEARSGLGETLVHFNPPRGLSASGARSAFERVLAVAPAYGEVRYHALEFAARDRNLARFDSLFRQLRPTTPQYHAWLAIRAFTWGDRREQQIAMRALQNADELEVGIAAARLAAHTNNFDAAEAVSRLLTRPEQTAQWRAGGHLLLAEIMIARGRVADAHRELQLAASLDHDWPHELRALFALHPAHPAGQAELQAIDRDLRQWNPGAHTPSLSFFLAAHATSHQHFRLYLLGLVNTQLGRVAEAEGFQRQLEQLTTEPEGQKLALALSRSVAGHIAARRGDRDRAINLLETATIDAPPEFVVLSPFYSRTHDRAVIAELHRQAGRPAEARRWYGSMLEGYEFMYTSWARKQLASMR